MVVMLLVGGICNQITGIIIGQTVPGLPGNSRAESGTLLQGATSLHAATLLQDETTFQAVSDLW